MSAVSSAARQPLARRLLCSKGVTLMSFSTHPARPVHRCCRSRQGPPPVRLGSQRRRLQRLPAPAENERTRELHGPPGALPRYRMARKTAEDLEAEAAAGPAAEGSGGRFPFKAGAGSSFAFADGQQMGGRWAADGPHMGCRWLQMGCRWLQMGRRWLQMGADGRRMGGRWAADGPQMGADGLQMGRRWLQMGRRWLQMARVAVHLPTSRTANQPVPGSSSLPCAPARTQWMRFPCCAACCAGRV
ncbi:hypothetical protein ABPG77_008101 [Micractinium sp. CCAP 211/92]